MISVDLNELSEKCKKNQRLFNVMFVLLNGCDQNCIHCYIPNHNSYGLPTQKIKDTILEARSLGALNITFTGGEILLRKDLFELIEFARNQFLRVFLMSNAYYLNETKIKRLSQLGIAEFSTTVFSMDPKIHDMITRTKGSFEQIYKNILLLKKYDISVTIKTPLMELNKYAYKQVEAFARENNFNFMTTTTIFTKADGDDSPHELQIRDGLHDITMEIEEILNNYRSISLSTNKEGIPCSAGFSNICINYDGDVWPCNSLMLKVGNILEGNLTNIWTNSVELNLWRKKSVEPISACTTCKLKGVCLRCPGMALLEDNNLYGCSSSAKKIAIEKFKGGS